MANLGKKFSGGKRTTNFKFRNDSTLYKVNNRLIVLEVGGKCVRPYLANANDDSNEDDEVDGNDVDVDDDGDDDVDDDDDGDDDDNDVNKEQGHHPPPTRWHLLPSDSVIKCIAFIIDHSLDKMRFGIIIFVCFVAKVYTLSSTNHQCQTRSNDISPGLLHT